MTKSNMVEIMTNELKLKATFQDLLNIVGSINRYDGSLSHLEFTPMEELEDFYCEPPLLEFLEHLEREFSARDDYFHDNGNGLESLSQWSVNDILENSLDEIIEELIKNIDKYINEIYISDVCMSLLKDIQNELDNNTEDY